MAFLQDLQARSRAGDIDAQFLLGLSAPGEIRFDRDGRQGARELILMAAQGGNADAQYYIARQSELWRPCASERGAAIWLEAAAERGSEPAAARKLAHFAASPFVPLRDPALAVRIANRVAALHGSPDPQLREALAAGHAAGGDFREAAALQSEALRMARRFGWNTIRIEERLASCRSRRMWYGDLLAVPPARQPLPDP